MPGIPAQTTDKGLVVLYGACTYRNRDPTRDTDWIFDNEHCEHRHQLVEGVRLTLLPTRWHRREEVQKPNNRYHSYGMDYLKVYS